MSASVRTTATNTATSAASVAVTITPAVGDLFVVLATATSFSQPSVWTCSDNNGGTYTQIRQCECGDLISTGASGVAFVRTSKLANTTSTVVTVSCNGFASFHGADVFAIAGMTGTGATAVRGSGKQDTQTAGTPAPALGAAALTANVTLGVLVTSKATNATTAVTPPTNWTEDLETRFFDGSEMTGIETIYRASGFTGTTITWGSGPGCPYGSIVLELDPFDPINGTYAATFAGITVAATGTATLKGAAAFTFADLTTTATGTSIVKGTSAFTFGGLTAAATGTSIVKGTGAFTFADLTVISTAGIHPSLGDASITLDGITLSATGTSIVKAASAFTLDGMTTISTATALAKAASSFTFAGLTLVAAGSSLIKASSSFTFDGITVDGEGEKKRGPHDPGWQGIPASRARTQSKTMVDTDDLLIVFRKGQGS